jgi:hypothetical protein
MNPDQNQSNDPNSVLPTPSVPPQSPEQPPVQPVEPSQAPTYEAPFGAPQQPAPALTQSPQPTSEEPTPTPAAGVAPSPYPASDAPTPPSTDSATTPVYAPIGGAPLTPEPKKKKGLIIGLSVAGALILLAAIAAVVYFVFFTVNREDYVATQTTLTTIEEEISNTDSLSTLPSSGSEDAIAEYKEKLELFKTEHAKLNGQKAILFDADVRDKYNAYNEKATAYIAFMEAIIPDMEVAAQLVEDQAEIQDGAGQSIEYYDQIIALYEDASKKLKDETLKSYFTASLEAMKEMKGALQTYSSETASATERQEAYTQLMTTLSELSDSAEEFGDEMTARLEAIDPRDTFDALVETVDAKVNEA